MRTSTVTRSTKETNISITLELDGSRVISIDTGIPFFDHMVTALAFYAGWDLDVQATGDLQIDDHHTVEDVGIVLGLAFKEALGDKVGITRFASELTPMDESLSQVVVDLSNRPMLVYNAPFTRETINGLSLENIKEFFYAFSMESRITLHASILYGENNHHMAEALFKGVGRTLRAACTIQSNRVTSTKGVL
jgi:imidazoleglycerol-phosphate dehydratase